MTALAYGRHRRPLRSFPTTTAENPRRGLVSRMLFALFILAAVVAAGFSVLDLALRTADQVFVDRAALKRNAEVEDIAGGVLYLASPLSGFMTGQTLVIDGGKQFI